MYAQKTTSEILPSFLQEFSVASLTNAPAGWISLTGIFEQLIHEPSCLAKDITIHTTSHGDSKPLPNNRTAKILLFYEINGASLLEVAPFITI